MLVLTLSSYSGEFFFSVVKTANMEIIGKGHISEIGEDQSYLTIHNNKNSPFTIKKTLFDFQDAIKEMTRWITDETYGFIKSINQLGLIAHRVIHGGDCVKEPLFVNRDLFQIIEENISLAPLHNNNNLLLIKACVNFFKTPQVAVFDNENFNEVPLYNSIYPIQKKIREKYHIKKYGFHGLYHYENTLKSVELTGIEKEKINLISIYLGRGKSVTAVKNGEIIDSTCGFATLAGIPTVKRVGNIDAAVIIHLLEKSQITLPELKEMLYQHSGLQAITEEKTNFIDFYENKDKNEKYKLAYLFFVMSIAKRIMELIPNFKKIDALAISGDNSFHPQLREDIIDKLSLLNIKIDKKKNNQNQADTIISQKSSKASIVIIKNHLCSTLAKVAADFYKKSKRQ